MSRLATLFNNGLILGGFLFLLMMPGVGISLGTTLGVPGDGSRNRYRGSLHVRGDLPDEQPRSAHHRRDDLLSRRAGDRTAVLTRHRASAGRAAGDPAVYTLDWGQRIRGVCGLPGLYGAGGKER